MMDLSNLRWSERMAVAETQVIVMSPQDDPLVAQRRIGSFDGAQDIAYRFPDPNDVRRQPDSNSRQLERFRFQISIHFLLNCIEVFPGLGKQLQKRTLPGVYRGDANSIAFYS